MDAFEKWSKDYFNEHGLAPTPKECFRAGMRAAALIVADHAPETNPESPCNLAAAVILAESDKVEYAWECNECGSQEYTMNVSEDDVQHLGCGNCGGCEWHKAEADK